MIAGIMELVAEAHVFAEKSGLDGGVLENLLEQNFGALAFSDSQRMTGGIYMPGKGKYTVLDCSGKRPADSAYQDNHRIQASTLP